MTIRIAPSALALPLLVLASACSGSPAADNQTASAAPAGTEATARAPTAKAVSQKVSNEFITWSLAYPAEVAAIPALAKTIADPSIAARKEVSTLR